MNTAVILSARKERDAQIPYPLMPFDNSCCLLDRHLSILHDLRFDNIIIVTGFCSELFERYASDDIHVIVNPEYEFTSSMASLSMVKDLVCDDFLLLEADTFCERKVLESLAAINEENCFVMTEESGSGDECYVETKSGFITKITKERHRICRFEGELLGISRISISTYRKLLEA